MRQCFIEKIVKPGNLCSISMTKGIKEKLWKEEKIISGGF